MIWRSNKISWAIIFRDRSRLKSWKKKCSLLYVKQREWLIIYQQVQCGVLDVTYSRTSASRFLTIISFAVLRAAMAKLNHKVSCLGFKPWLIWDLYELRPLLLIPIRMNIPKRKVNSSKNKNVTHSVTYTYRLCHIAFVKAIVREWNIGLTPDLESLFNLMSSDWIGWCYFGQTIKVTFRWKNMFLARVGSILLELF